MKGFTREELLEMAWEKPILAQIGITSLCNRHCPFCYAWHRAAETKPDLPLLEWQGMILKLRRLGVQRLDFTGRESLLYDEATALFAWCKEQGFENRLNTNGTVDVTAALPYIDEIVYSVHGLGDIHDQIMGSPGDFYRVKENMERTAKAGVKISVNMSLLKSNYHQLNLVFDYFDSQYGLYKFAPFLPVPSLYGKDFSGTGLEINRESLSDYLDCLRRIPVEKLTLKHGFHSIFIAERKHYRDNGLLLPNCAAGKYKLIVENDGRVFPCNFFRSQEFYCGNLLTDDETTIWRSGAGFKHFRDLVLGEKIPAECSQCLKKPRCYSGCRAWSLTYQKGGFENVKDKRCDPGSAFIGS
ncbi:MAG: radical SAM protein [Patescibacteria group bacterium]|jgi:radical SAM protein with 4Fe4S-binding SPASM domain